MKKTILLVICLAFFSQGFSQNVPSYVPTNGLVGWWPFNGNTNDESGNGLNGVLLGGGNNLPPTLIQDRFSNPNSAYNFGGQGSGISLPAPQAGTFNNALSYSIWINQDIINDYLCVIDPTYSGKICLINPNSQGIRAYNGSSFYISGTDSLISLSGWKHLVVVYSNTTIQVYINGILISQGNTSGLISFPDSQTLLGIYSGTIYSYVGLMDDLAIWNRALTQQEIDSLYTGGSPQPPPPCVSLPTNLQNGLVGWWPFCGNANDESGNGLNGTVNGATLTSDRFGNFNSAYDFASGSQLIELPAPVPNTFTNSMSYSIWFKEIPSIDFLNIFNAAGKALVLNPNATGIRANDGNSFYLQGNSAALTVNDWKHVCVIYQGQDISIYINGVLVVSGTTGFPATIQYLSQPSIVGSTYLMAGQYPFIGLIDDIGIWNRALTQQEIDTLFSGGSPQPPPPCVSLPTNLQNGLVGWWPFCGNANDESGNGNNGTASGAQLSIDRFGNSNNAYYFDGQDDYVGIPAVPSLLPNNISISAWVKIPSLYTANNPIGRIIRTRFFGYLLYFDSTSHNINFVTYNDPVNLPGICQSTGVQYNDDSWHHVVVTFDGSINNLFIDGLLVASVPPTGPDIYYQSDGLVVIGKDGNSTNPLLAHYQGWVDDIGIWNRALTPNEITQLNCGILPVVNPPAAITSTGINAVFTASASVNNVSYQWQTNPANTGWVNVIDNATYSGSSTNQLTVSNVQLSNHLQPFRVIASDTNCTDTSNVGSIFISDTCLVTVYDTTVVTVYDSITVIDTLLVTVYDTIYTSVTDTLIITLTGLQTPSGGIDVLVYPNPASASVQINFGPDYTAMVNYNLRIYNAGGSNVYGPVAGINQQLFTVPIAGWAPGIYFLELLDTGTSNTIVRKIVIQ